MRVVRCSLLLLLTLAAPFAANLAHGDEPKEGDMATTAKEELIALCDAWVAAEINGDRATLERVLHEDFLNTFSSGRTVDRTTFIEGILKNSPPPFTVTHDSIRVFGDTAVVIDVSDDLTESGAVKFTWTAIRRDGQWRVISETISAVEAG